MPSLGKVSSSHKLSGGGSRSRLGALGLMLRSKVRGGGGATPTASQTSVAGASGEDQQIAKLAVHTVVQGSKKGISTLCSDVAQIMRDRHRLERENKVMRKELAAVQGENEMLKSMLSAAQSSGSSGYHTADGTSSPLNSPVTSDHSLHCHCAKTGCELCHCHVHYSSCGHCCICSANPSAQCTCVDLFTPCSCTCHGYQSTAGIVVHAEVEPVPRPESSHRYRKKKDVHPILKNSHRSLDSGLETSRARDSIETQTKPVIVRHVDFRVENKGCQSESDLTSCGTGDFRASSSLSSLAASTASQTMDTIVKYEPPVHTVTIPELKFQTDMTTQTEDSMPQISDSQVQTVTALMNSVDTQTTSIDPSCVDEGLQVCPETEAGCSQTDRNACRESSAQAPPNPVYLFNVESQTEESNIVSSKSDQWTQFPLFKAEEHQIKTQWEHVRTLVFEPPLCRTPLVTIEPNALTKFNIAIHSASEPVSREARETLRYSVPRSKSFSHKVKITPMSQYVTSSSPDEFVDFSTAYQSPQNVFIGQRMASCHKPGGPEKKASLKKIRNGAEALSPRELSFASYEGPKLSTRTQKKVLGFKKGSSWDNYVNMLPPRLVLSCSSTESEETSHQQQLEASGLQPSVLTCPVPMVGCRCPACLFVFQYAPIGPGEAQDDADRLGMTLGERVQLPDGRSGQIRYVGHVASTRNPNSVYAGIELNEPRGNSDGSVDGVKYFCCSRNRGVFVPYQDIIFLTKEKKKSLMRRSTSSSK